MNVSLIIPLFNNAGTLSRQLVKCQTILSECCRKYEIIVCDDASNDTSRKLLQKYFKNRKEYRLIFHKKNMGISKTIRELYIKAKYEYILNYSVDGDWDPNDIKKLILIAHRERSDIVIGVRRTKVYSPWRRCISYWYNFLPVLLFGVHTHDAGSIKIIRKQIFQRLRLQSSSVFFEAEIIIRAVKLGYRIQTCSIHHKRTKGDLGAGGTVSLVLRSFYDLLRLRIVGVFP